MMVIAMKKFSRLRKTALLLMLSILLEAVTITSVSATPGEFVLAFSNASNRMYVNGQYELMEGSIKPLLEGGKTYVPVKEVMKTVGGSFTYDDNTKIASITTPDKDVWFTSTKLRTLYQKRDEITKSYIIYKDSTLYMEAAQLAKLLGMELLTSDDVVVMTNLNGPDDRAYEAIKSQLYYVRPEESEIIARLVKENPNNAHPRLFAREEDWVKIREKIANDKDVAAWFDRIKKTADQALDSVPYRYVLENPGGLLNPIQNRIAPRLEVLCFMYQATKDPKYAERAYLEMESICEFPDWGGAYLPYGQMLYTMSIAYDWCYDWMNASQRKYVKDKIVKLGLNNFVKSYEVFWSGRQPLDPNRDVESWWTRIESNWNPWVNGGVIQACLAIGDEEPELCGYYLRSALSSLELCLEALAPDGASVEGIGYGGISTQKFTYAMACMDSALGSDYGYFNSPGFSGFASFLNHMNGPATSFIYHDAGTSNAKAHFGNAFFVANKNTDYAMAKVRLNALRDSQTQASIFDIIWYKPGVYEDADLSNSLDKYFRKAETGSMRSSFDDANALWLAFHGGGNYVSHAHLDSGVFVLDAMGLNWAVDMGTESITYDSTKPYDDRWLLYRIGPSGHNTLQINRNSDYGQMVNSFSPVTKFETKPGGAFALMDLTEAYGHVASEMRRGFGLFDSRRRAVVQDEIKLKSKSDIWWSMHTPAQIELAEDGKTAYLKQKGKTLRVSVVEPQNAVLHSMKAEPLEGMPTNDKQNKNKGIQKLCINVPDTAETNIRVEFTPIYSEFDMTKAPLGFESLDSWQAQNAIEEIPALKSISLDGAAIDGFEPGVVSYDIPVPVGSEHIYSVSAMSDHNIEIIQPETAGEATARINLFDKGGVLKNVYTLNFTNKPFIGLPKNTNKVYTIKATSSVPTDAGTPASAAIDSDPTTRWSALDEAALTVELEEEADISYVCMAFYTGNKRSTYFDIETSTDGKTWTHIYKGESCGTTEDTETYPIPTTRAKYVRINSHGNSLSGYGKGWNSITELALFAQK